MDCALKSFFPKDKSPVIKNKKEDVLDVVKVVIGEQIEARVVGCFKIAQNELPDLGVISSMYTEKKADTNVTLRITGSTLSLTGVPVDKIVWWESDSDNGMLGVRIEGSMVTEITEDYLFRMWEWIREQFSLFVLGNFKG